MIRLTKGLEDKVRRGVVVKCPECRKVYEEAFIKGRRCVVSYPQIPYFQVIKEGYHKKCKEKR